MKTRKYYSTDYPILFFMLDSADHRTGKTGLSVTVTISKNGGSFAAASGAVTEIGHGWYSLAGNADDRDTLGQLLLHATASGADPCDDAYAIGYFDPFWIDLGSPFLDDNITNVAGGVTNGLEEWLTKIDNLHKVGLEKRALSVATPNSSSTIVSGSATGGTYASAGALDGSYWTIGGSSSLDVRLEFDVTPGEACNAVLLRLVSDKPAYVYVSSDAVNWTYLGYPSNKNPDLYVTHLFSVSGITADSGKIYVKLTSSFYAPISMNVDYAVVLCPASGGGMTAEETRAALGLATANLDAQLAALPTAEGNADAVRTELATELAHLDADVSSAGLTAQETRDAMKLAPSAGAAVAGSIDAKLDTIDANVDAIKLTTDALDVTAVTQVATSSAGHLTITAGLTFDEGVTGLTIPADWEVALWTLKNNARDADTAALVQLRVTNPAAGSDGLQRLNGAALVAPITAADGELTVTQPSGRIDVYLTDEMTALLGAATAIGWDVKFIDAAGDSSGQRGTADVVLTETKSTA